MAISGSLNFITASEFGSYLKPGSDANRRFGLDKNDAQLDGSTRNGFIPTDFVGLNTNIHEPFDLNSSFLGYTSSYSIMSYVNVGTDGNDTTKDGSSQGYGGFINVNYQADEAGDLGFSTAYIFNALMLHRNGPYQRPMWQQFRDASHPIARYLRLHNTMSISSKSPWNMADPANKANAPLQQHQWGKHNEHDPTTPKSNYADNFILFQTLDKYSTTVKFYESAVVSNHLPLKYTVNIGDSPAIVRQTLFNELTYFTNEDLNKKLKLSDGKPPNVFDNVNDFYIKRPMEPYRMLQAAKQIDGMRDVTLKERIYPREVNTYRPTTRKKDLYDEVAGTDFKGYDRVSYRTFWRDSQANRARTDDACLNSQGYNQRIPFQDYIARSGSQGDNSLKNYMCSNQYYMSGSVPFVAAGVVTWQRESEHVKYPPSGSSVFGQQREMYQPYQIALNSMWPLDVRSDIYDRPYYLAAVHNSGTHSDFSDGPSVAIGLSPLAPAALMSSRSFAAAVTSSITRSAGELVYSTKPTILYWAQQINATSFVHEGHPTVSGKSADDTAQEVPIARVSGSRARNRGLSVSGDTHTGGLTLGSTGDHPSQYNANFSFTGSSYGSLRDGYHAATASLQFLRHAYPYQTPYWAAHLISERNPMYDSYEDFSQDLYYIGKDYSIVPEFRYSEHYDYYTPRFGMFTSPNLKMFGLDTDKGYKAFKRNYSKLIEPKVNFLTIDGVDLQQTQTDFSSGPQNKYEFKTQFYELDDLDYTSNTLAIVDTPDKSYKAYPQSVEFHGKYTETEPATNFSYLLRLGDNFTDGEETIPSRITLKFMAIKKLLPYNGFYPVSRTVQIGTHLSQAFGSYLTGTNNEDLYTNYPGAALIQASGTLQAARLQALLEPLMAPGLLYNSIKSGIAVNHPIYRSYKDGAPEQEFPMKYFGPRQPNWYGEELGAEDPAVTNVGHSTNRFGFSDKLGQVARHLCISKASSTYGEGIQPHSKAAATPPESATGNYSLEVFTNNMELAVNDSHGLHYHADFVGLGHGSMMGVASAMPTFLKVSASFKLPFEALYTPSLLKQAFKSDNDGEVQNASYLPYDFIDEARARELRSTFGETVTNAKLRGAKGSRTSESSWTPLWNPDASFSFGAILGGPVQRTSLKRYQSSMSNFLCETMDFFLEGGDAKFPVIQSNPIYGGIELEPKTYTMDVQLHQAKDHVLCEGPRLASLNTEYGKKHVRAPNTGPDRVTSGSAMMRGALFGPPVQIIEPLKIDETNLRYTYIPNIFKISNDSGPANGDEIRFCVNYHNARFNINSAWDDAVNDTRTGDGDNPGWVTIRFVTNLTSGDITTDNLIEVKIGSTTAETAQRAVNAINGVDLTGADMSDYYKTGADIYAPYGSGHSTYGSLGRAKARGFSATQDSTYPGVYIPPFGILATTGSTSTSWISIWSTIPHPVTRLSGNIGSESSHATAPYIGFDQKDASSSNRMLNSSALTSTSIGWVSGGMPASSLALGTSYLYGAAAGVPWEKLGETQFGYYDSSMKAVNSASSELYYNLQDPAYQAYTPPYFYGPSSAVISFKAEGTTNYKLSEIVSNTRSNSYYFEEYYKDLCPRMPSTGSLSSGSMNRMKIEASVDIWESTKGNEGKNNIFTLKAREDEPEKEGEVWWMAPKWMAPVLDMSEDSVPYRKTTRYQKNGDVLQSDKVTEVVTSSGTQYYGHRTGRSIWMGYGYDPYDEDLIEAVHGEGHEKEKGIWLTVKDVNIGVSGDQATTPGFVTDIGSNTALAATRESAFGNQDTASLGDALGFHDAGSGMTYPLGRMNNAKLVSEAVVAIPYFEKGFQKRVNFPGEHYDSTIYGTVEILPGKHFLRIWNPLFERMLSRLLAQRNAKVKAGVSLQEFYQKFNTSEIAIKEIRKTDLGKMIATLIGDVNAFDPASAPEFEAVSYVLPPEMDFIHNKAVTPFQMLIAPFYQFLDKQDLTNIYQGLMPDCSMRAEKDFVKITTSPGRGSANINDIFDLSLPGGGTADLSSAGLANFLSPMALKGNYGIDPEYVEMLGDYPNSSAEFYSRLRWMTFKIKQRAHKNYEMYRYRHIENAIMDNLDAKGESSLITNSRFNPGDQASLSGISLEPTYFSDVYGMNWPYDYFSLVEKLKIEAEFKVDE